MRYDIINVAERYAVNLPILLNSLLSILKAISDEPNKKVIISSVPRLLSPARLNKISLITIPKPINKYGCLIFLTLADPPILILVIAIKATNK